MSKRSATETVSAIFLAFLEKTSWSQADLARRLGLSVRAVRARLEELERQGMKIEREDDPPHVVWSVPLGWFPDGLTLERTEVASLLRLLSRAPRSPAREALLARLVLMSKVATITPNATPLAEAESILSLLEDARDAKRSLRVFYRTIKTGVETWRTLSVQHIEHSAPIRVLAFCHTAGTLRTFRLSGIREARIDPSEPYVKVPNEEVQDLLRKSIDGWADDQAPREVTFVVYGEDVRWVQGKLPSPGMIVETCDGGIRVKAVTSGVLVIARFVAGLGGAAVAETPELAEKVEELVRGSVARLRQTASERSAATAS